MNKNNNVFFSEDYLNYLFKNNEFNYYKINDNILTYAFKIDFYLNKSIKNNNKKLCNSFFKKLILKLIPNKFSFKVSGNPNFSNNYAWKINSEDLISSYKKIINYFDNEFSKEQFIILKDFTNITEGDLNKIKGNFIIIPSDPICVFDIKPNWNLLVDYYKDLEKKYRQRFKQSFNKSNDIIKKNLSFEEIKSNYILLFNLYKLKLQTVSFEFMEIKEDYFLQMKNIFKDDFQIFAYYKNDIIIGFISTLKHNDILEAHYLGYKEEYNLSHKIYLRMLYDYIEIGINLKCKKINFGRTAIEIKTTIGAYVEPAFILIKAQSISKMLILRLISLFIKHPKYIIRHPFK